MRCQSYPVDHAIYINGEVDTRELYDDLQGRRLFMNFGPPCSKHKNYVHSLSVLPYELYDLFCKVDDDDVYRTNYIEGVVRDFLRYRWDCSGTWSNGVIKGKRWLPQERWSSLGISAFDRQLGVIDVMPPTFAFSRRGIECILGLVDDAESIELDWQPGDHEDVLWRRAIARAGLERHVREESDFSYHIHGRNVSTTLGPQDWSSPTPREVAELTQILLQVDRSSPLFKKAAVLLHNHLIERRRVRDHAPRPVPLGGNQRG